MYEKFKYCSYKQNVQIVLGEKGKASFKLTSHISQKSQITLAFFIFTTIGDFYDI